MDTKHGHRSDHNDESSEQTEVLTLPVRDVQYCTRSACAPYVYQVCTNETLRAVRQVTRPVAKTYHSRLAWSCESLY